MQCAGQALGCAHWQRPRLLGLGSWALGQETLLAQRFQKLALCAPAELWRCGTTCNAATQHATLRLPQSSAERPGAQVYAQLLIEGKNYGLHVFMVQVRHVPQCPHPPHRPGHIRPTGLRTVIAAARRAPAAAAWHRGRRRRHEDGRAHDRHWVRHRPLTRRKIGPSRPRPRVRARRRVPALRCFAFGCARTRCACRRCVGASAGTYSPWPMRCDAMQLPADAARACASKLPHGQAPGTLPS
jgi:hypothetical protein